MKVRKKLLIALLVLLICIPTVFVQAQSDDTQPLDDEFVNALVMAAVSHNMMEGKDENSDLGALKGFVDFYYSVRIAVVRDSVLASGDQEVQWLHQQRDGLVRKIQGKIRANTEARRWPVKMMELLFGGGKDPDEDLEPAVPLLPIVSGNDNPPPDYIDTMNSQIRTDFEAQVNAVLDIHTIEVKPALAPVISNSTAWNYDVPAITNSTAPISAPGPSVQQPGEGNNETLLKPLRFSNSGFEPVTVVVESYLPAPGYSPAKSTASTVVFQESNPSGYLDLPLGTYTFCYYWELDEDYNEDGYFDYYHKSTGPVTLTIKSSDTPERAVSVTLSPDSNVSSPNGKCGEVVVESSSNLTPEEAANVGKHTYEQTCSGIFGGGSCDDSGVDMISLDISFSSGTVTGITADGESVVVPRIGMNQYQLIAEDGGVSTVTFTADGFVLHFVATGGEWPSDAILTHIRQ